MSARPLVLASGNAGKLREFNHLLNGLGFEVKPQSEFNVPEAAENGLTFVENAIIKARNACKYTGLPALADDSGIEVDALNGAPGIYSARFAGSGATDADNNQKLLDSLANVATEQRTARYQCVLVYMRHELDPTPVICQASWEGIILESPMGDGGFGYDPLFWLPDYHMASAQLPKDEKNRVSHRGKAMQLLLEALIAQQ